MKPRISHPKKAQWIYHCEHCDHTQTSVDRFRAIEAQQNHERGYGHLYQTLGAAAKELTEPFKRPGLSAENATKLLIDALTLANSQDAYALLPPPAPQITYGAKQGLTGMESDRFDDAVNEMSQTMNTHPEECAELLGTIINAATRYELKPAPQPWVTNVADQHRPKGKP